MPDVPPYVMRLLEAIRFDHSAVTFHPDDPHRDVYEAGAAQLDLICVPDPKVEFRRIYGCPAPTPPRLVMPAAATEPRTIALAEPPPGILVRSEWGDIIWRRGTDNWVGIAPNGTRPTAAWDELAAGKFGPIELLIPVPAHVANADAHDQLSHMLDQMMLPIIEAMENLGAAAVSSFRALLAEAYRRGEFEAVSASSMRQPSLAVIEEMLAKIRAERAGDAE